MGAPFFGTISRPTGRCYAAGFYISEVGARDSLGTAGVANPVNTVSADSSPAEAGGSDGGNAGNIAAIPAFFMVKKLDDRVRVGFSPVAPQGGTLRYVF